MRLKIHITGIVQGVGFRPFVFRLAKNLNLKGYVLNSDIGVVIEVEGDRQKLEKFLLRLQSEKPRISKIYSLEYKFLENVGYTDFKIRESEKTGERKVSVLPDIATCDECVEEIFDPKNRRYRYPFTNCTNCGPRFTIIESLPYDRERTTMKVFKMCPDCYREYTDPNNRRFHAQPNACPVCGPHVTLVNAEGKPIAEKDEALRKTVKLLRKDKIVAIKGLGGFHLTCDATSESAVSEMRKRKKRYEKPFAVMFPSIDVIKRYARVSTLEERALRSVECPIVVLEQMEHNALAPSCSPNNNTIGAFLPYTPLHHILLRDFGKPIIATSANTTDEPIVKDNGEALERLKGISDYFLIHNRDIKRRCDDSVVMIVSGRQSPIRRSRGFAPLPVILPFELKRKVLAVGPFMKNTIALGDGNKVYISQHIGDLNNIKAESFFEETISDLTKLFDFKPDIVACDMHPGYYSTEFAEREFPEKLQKVYHHHAHIVSCMAENEVPLDKKVIGIAFDGTGYGLDGTIWGGEFLLSSYYDFKRLFHLRTFKLPGGDKAVKEPYRTAVSILMETDIEPESILNVDRKKIGFVQQMIEKNVNSPITSSMGRLFDAVSAILGISYFASYHAQAAILLEQLASRSTTTAKYPFELKGETIDFSPIVKGIVGDLEKGSSKACIAKKFHNTVSEFTVNVVERIAESTGLDTVALSGGVFQNRILTESIFKLLKTKGFNVLIHQLVPSNDGGISLGQAVCAGLR